MKMLNINKQIQQSKEWVQFEDTLDLEFDQFVQRRQDLDVSLRERHDSGDGSASFTTSSVSSTSSVKEEGPYSAIRGLDQSPEASKDWSLNIDRSPITGWSPEILQSPTVSSTTRNSFIYGSLSMSPIASDNQSPIPSSPKSFMSPEVNFCTDGSPSTSPIPKGFNPFITGSPPTPFTPKSSLSPKGNPFTDGSPKMSPIPDGSNPFITGSPPTPSTRKSSMSSKVNPFIAGSPSAFPTQKNYQCPTNPERFNPFIAGSLFLPNVSPTPSGYQCPPSTPTSCITPKIQLKGFKYSDLQELGQSPKTKGPSRQAIDQLADFSPKGKYNQVSKLFKNQEDLLNEFNQLEF
jgi:hypothetical protein